MFISHSSNDFDYANKICKGLEAAGIACWIAPRNIPETKTYDTEIINAIKGASAVVLVESSNADNSDMVRREVERAVNYKIPIIRFKIEKFELVKLEFLISINQFLDAFSIPFEHSLKKLIKRVELILIHQSVGENEVVVKSAAFTNRHRLLLEKSREGLLNYINSFGKKHFKEAGKEIEIDLIPQIVRCSDNALLCVGDIAGKGGEHFLIFGEGGGGKSSVLLHLWQELLRQANSSDVEDYSPVPIKIPLSDLALSYGPEGVKESIIYRPLSLYLKTKTNFFSHTDAETDTATNLNHNYIQQEINYLSDCLRLHKRNGSAQHMAPFFVLLLDGYNELRTNIRAAVDAEIIQLSRQGVNIQIILTTRHYISNALSAVFEELELQGLTDAKVEKYLKSQNVPPPRSSGIIPLIRNPMILTLYCEGEKARVNYEKRNNKTTLFLKDNDSVSSILWNYIQLSVKLRGIWEPYSDLHEERERLYYVLNRILPELAWDMVLNGMHQISQEDLLTKLSDGRLGKIDYAGTKEIVRFLNEDVCLLTRTEGDDARVFFQHQNYRDFFAAVYITAAYDDYNKKRSIVRENIGTHILPIEIAGFVGELLNEHNNAPCGDSILINIIREGASDKNTIYNISQIYKALDLLDLTLDYFAGVDFSHINFINVRKELILKFISKILSQIRHVEVIKEIVAKATRQQHMAFPALNKVENALRISLMAATDSKPELTERFFQVWRQWVNDIYSYKAQIVSCLLLVGAGVGGKNEEQLTRTVEKVLQSEKKALPGLVRGLVVKQNGVSFFDKYIARKASSQIVHSIRGANLLQGEGHILTIFDEAEKKQRQLIILLDKLLEPPSVNDSLLEHIYEVASWNSIVSNFVILNICYLLINDLGKGFELVSGLYHKAKATDESECIALVNWKIYSSINFTVQESKFKEASDIVNMSRFDDNKDFYSSNFKPLMNSISADIVLGWINGERPERDYSLEYYFPLGVLAEFDMTMGDNFTKRMVIESVFEEKGVHNISLLQRFIYETSCMAADSYHAKFESYMEETFNTMTEIVEMIIPIYDMLRPGEQYALKYSLFEAFSILSYLEPVQTTTHFGELIRTYGSSSLLIEMAEKIEEQRRVAFSRGIAVDDDFVKYVSNPVYYVSDSLINGTSVKDLVANCKNTWMVSDLGVSTLTQSDQARAYIGEKIVRDLLNNCNTYARAPEQFISSLILTILAELNKAPA